MPDLDKISPWEQHGFVTIEPAPRRRRRRQQIAAAESSRMVSTVEMAGLAGRLGAGTATIEDLHLAEKLLLAMLQMLPPNGTIGIDP